MKLRISGDSIRLRLSRSEVARFVASGEVEDSVHFGGGGELTYRLQAAASAEQPRATFDNGHIAVIVPQTDAQKWATTDQVGIEGDGIVVEKDFQCMHGDKERDADAFPNPMAN
ncbi:MAG TPA: hypothetical protein VKU01_12470 [Bryobacteraceae bacterium]|nr:hypothetical protein [Bryobacteraceae bacterium]